MTFRNLMIVGAVIAAGFGIGFMLAPGPLTALYGLALDPAGLFVARLLGIEFFGYGLLAWLVRGLRNTHIRRVILLDFFITGGLGFLVALLAQLGGLMNPLGWSAVAIFLLLAAGYGYLRFGARARP